MDKVLAGTTVAVNEEGYLENLDQWNKAVAQEIATEFGINFFTINFYWHGETSFEFSVSSFFSVKVFFFLFRYFFLFTFNG